MNAFRSFIAFIGLCLLPSPVAAQSFNLDEQQPGPGFLFPGAANQPGYWNAHSASSEPRRLSGLAGELTAITWRKTESGGSSVYYNNPLLSGDYKALMADGEQVGSRTYIFSGLERGIYRVYTYVGMPSPGATTETHVDVVGAVGQTRQTVTGPLTGNIFKHLVTHALHELELLSGDITIRVSADWPQAGYVFGFQFVKVNIK